MCIRLRGICCLLLVLAGATGRAAADEAPAWESFSEGDRAAVVSALGVLNMTPADPGFTKDIGEPRWALARVRTLLGAPLELPRWGDEVMQAARAADGAAILAAIPTWLEAPVPSEPGADRAPAWVCDTARLDARVAAGLTAAVAHLGAARARVDAAVAALEPTQRVAAAAVYLGGAFQIEDHPERRATLEAGGMPAAALEAAVAENADTDPRPGGQRMLDVAMGVNVEALVAAAAEARLAVGALRDAVAGGAEWPASPVQVETPAGIVVVGTTGDDVYAEDAVLVVEPGGDDRYGGTAGQANGLRGHGLSVILDLAGDDRYLGRGLLAPGAALFGVAVLVDDAGADQYRGDYVGCGAGLFGGAWMEDRAGDDDYRAQALAQGAAVAGFAVLCDAAGADHYDLGFCGQGFAGTRAVGLLIDGGGNDRYSAGGVLPDFDRNAGRFVSLAQGVSLGMRPFAGGGLGALVDLGGNDTYVADVYGQGVGYWYAAGMLLDRQGEDTYQLFQYGQGSGIHLSLGLLVDGGGPDAYTGAILCQGNAHDYAVGMLIDQGGNDVYTGDHHVQGRAINNAFALLRDRGGDDAYFARQPDRAQGIGDNGADRDYGCLSLLVDGGGVDRYSAGAGDGAALERPDFGVIADAPGGAAEVAP